MRVCLLSKEYPPDTGWGGIGAYNYQIAHGLKEIGHDVEVIALAKSDVSMTPLTKNTKPVMEEGIIVHRVPWQRNMSKHSGMLITAASSHFMFKTNMLLWKKLVEVHDLRPFDVLETPEHLAEGLIPAVAKWLPVVIKLHTPYSKFISEKFHNTTAAFEHQLIAMLERLAMLSADVLISPSSDMAQFVSQDINYPREKIKSVKNPIDATMFSAEGPKAIAVDGRITVLFVGRLEERKGIYYLIKAIPQIIDSIAGEDLQVRFLIIGGDTTTAAGHKPVLPQLKQMVASFGCTDNVIFIPHVSLADMPAYYRSADICIVPSLYDNAPYTCLEAMSCGRPVIGTAAGGIPEYITDGETGLIIPAADTNAIVTAVTRLLKNEDERRHIGQNARNYILGAIHRSKIARQNEEAYKLAISDFAKRKEKALYRKGAAQSLADADGMFYSYHTMLYDLLYVYSWRFRMSCWLKLLLSRPKLVLYKLIVSISGKFFPVKASRSTFLVEISKRIESMENGAKTPSQVGAGEQYMRICLISHEYPPDTGWGGIATFAYHLSQGLKENGHDVEIVSLAVDSNAQSIYEGIKVHRVLPYDFSGGLNILNLCMPYSRNALRTASALWNKALQLHQENPFEVIDVPELLAQGIYPAMINIAPLTVRLYTPHSKFIAERFHNVKPAFDHDLIAAFERMAMLTADALTAPSNDLAHYMADDLNISPEQIHIVFNPIEPEQFSPDGNKSISPDGRFTVLFVGRLEERKGIHYLIEAIPSVIKACPNIRFVIIGDDTQTGAGSSSVLSQLKQSIHAANCQDNVIWIDRVPLQELAAYYRSADLCVVPSVYDNSPYTCLEAMSCGKAVIGTTGGGMPDYIVEGKTGRLVAPRNTEALAAAIMELSANPEQCLLFGQNGRVGVLDKFRRIEIAKQTVEVYKLAINSFLARRDSALYRKPAQEFLTDVQDFVYVFDKAVGDFLYFHSWGFRFRHWCSLYQSPKLIAAKIYMKVAALIGKITGRQKMTANLVNLKQEIDLQQDALRRR